MDEHEYLAFLQRLYGDPSGTEPDWTAEERRWNQARAKQLGRDPAGYLTSKEEVRRARGPLLRHLLVEPLLKVATRDNLKKLERVPIGVINVRSLNAQAFRAPNGAPVITFNQGLLSLISYWWELKATLPAVEKNRGPHAASQFRINAYSFLLLFYKDNGQQDYPWPAESLDEQTMQWVLMRSLQTEMFVVAHELSHVFLGHPLESPSTSSPPAPEDLTGQHELSKLQEHEADAIGYSWYLRAWAHSDFADGRMRAPDFFAPLEYLALRHLVELNPETVPSPLEPTHPTAMERVRLILSMLTEMKLDKRLRKEVTRMTDEYASTVESMPNMVQYLTTLGQWIEQHTKDGN